MAKLAERMEGISQMVVGDMVDLIAPLYATAIRMNTIHMLPSLMLWGPPGVGKSDSFKAIAKELKTLTGKIVNIIDVRLLLFNPVDLRGIPVADIDEITKQKVAKWLKPLIFQMSADPNVVNILILDEISAAPPSVQAAAYQITLDRTIGEHKLPDNCFIVAAGNRLTDKSVAYKMPKALANRLCHIEIGCEVEDWKRWAVPHGIDSRIVAFLSFKPTLLFDFDPNSDTVAFPTPRSWQMVNEYLKYGTIDDVMPLINGVIGSGAAIEFKAYSKVFGQLPDIDAILEGKEKTVPTKLDVLFAVSSSISSKIAADIADLDGKITSRNIPQKTKTKIANALTYSMAFPPEYATLLVKDLISLKLTDVLAQLPEWLQWSTKNAQYLSN